MSEASQKRARDPPAVDLTDDAAVHSVINAVRETDGRVDVLIHAAGVEISRFLGDKPRSEFELVYDIKCAGWQSLLCAIGDMPLKAAMVHAPKPKSAPSPHFVMSWKRSMTW